MKAEAGMKLGEKEFETAFAWKTPRGRRRFRLVIFLFVALAVHALLFYFFQVVYPPSKRLVRQPAGIILLSPATPGALSVLESIADRTPTFEGTLGSNSDDLSLKIPFEANYVESYGGYEPELLALDFGVIPKPLPLLAAPGGIVLPRMPKEPEESTAEASMSDGPSAPTWRVEGALQGREMIVGPRQLVGVDLEELAGLGMPPKFRLAADRSGNLTFVGLASLLSKNFPQHFEVALRDAVAGLRFAPDQDAPKSQLGWLVFEIDSKEDLPE